MWTLGRCLRHGILRRHRLYRWVPILWRNRGPLPQLPRAPFRPSARVVGPRPGMVPLHSAAWWRRHWEQSGIMDIEVADTMPDGWQRWLDWHRQSHSTTGRKSRRSKRTAAGYLGYVRVVGRRRQNALLQDPVISVPLTTRGRRCSVAQLRFEARPEVRADGWSIAVRVARNAITTGGAVVACRPLTSWAPSA